MTKLRVKPENDTNMKCREAELQIIDFLAQRPSAGMPAELAGHLVSCSSCSALLKEYSAGFNTLASGRRKVADPTFYDRLTINMQVKTNSHLTTSKPVVRILHLRPLFIAVAASLILGIWLGGRLFNVVQPDSGDENTLSGQQRVALLDAYASDLHLNDDATLALENYLIDFETPGTNDTK